MEDYASAGQSYVGDTVLASPRFSTSWGGSLIIGQFGVHKSGSSFCVQLLQEMLRRAGFEVHGGGNVKPVDQAALKIAQGRVRGGSRVASLIKTHDAPLKTAREWLSDGRLGAVLTQRDPRDIIVSVLEAGAADRQKGEKSLMARIETFDQAMASVRRDFDSLARWRSLPGTHMIDFRTLTETPAVVIRDLAAFVGITADADAILSVFRDKESTIRRFNVGRPGRHVDRLSDAQRQAVEHLFADVSDLMIERPRPEKITVTAQIPTADSVQAQIDAVWASGGGTVCLPAGILRLKKGFRLRSHVHIRGAGQAETLLLPDDPEGFDEPFFFVDDNPDGVTRDLRVEDLSIDGLFTPEDQAYPEPLCNDDVALRALGAKHYRMGMYLCDRDSGGGFEDIVLRNLTIRNCSNGIQFLAASRIDIESCVFERNGCIIHHNHNLYLRRCSDVLIRDVVLNGSPHGCGLNVARGCSGIRLRRVTARDNGFRGMRFDGSERQTEDVDITDCVVANNSLAYPDEPAVRFHTVRRFKMTRSRIDTRGAEPAVQVRWCQYGELCENQISGQVELDRCSAVVNYGPDPAPGVKKATPKSLTGSGSRPAGPKPRHLTEVMQQAKALTVVDGDMSPWCEVGETVYYQHGQPPHPFEHCVVDLSDGTSLIRRYEEERGQFVFLRRLKPDQVELVARRDILGLHRILLRGL